MSAYNTPMIDYDGPEADSIFIRSVSQWQAALRHATSIPGFPESSYKLERLLSRMPSFPDDILSSSSSIEGYSTWKSSDASCSLECKTEKRHKFHLRRLHPTTCTISTSDNFQVWEGNPNNGLALLVLAWAYILTASLAERQHLSLQYGPLDSPSGSVEINLDYASPQELTWWKAIIARGSAYSIAADNRYSPWGVLVDNLDLEVVGEIDVNHSPPTAGQAAGYLARLCVAFDLGSQCSAALAAALSLPLHRSTAPLGPVTIELPRPLLSIRVETPRQCQYPTDFRLLDRYMTLSLSPNYFGSTLWSVFLEPNVPCNFAGAWLGPIGDVLRPIIQENKLELLAKVLSFTNIAPLWLGLALCGRRTIIKSIMPFLDELRPYPHTQPFIDAAAWTSIAQSFMDIHPPGPYLQDGKISRANIWRLRHDCHKNYEDDSFLTTPQHGWPPFGTMRSKDVELELLDHLNCSHQWKYSFWTWLPSGIRDTGFLDDKGDSYLPQEPLHLYNIEIEESKSQQSRINYAASQAATKRIFEWCSSQVEKGFGGSLVPRREFYPLLDSAESDVSFNSDAIDSIEEWRKTLCYRRRRKVGLDDIVVRSREDSVLSATRQC
jgi:hypothetical protein